MNMKLVVTVPGKKPGTHLTFGLEVVHARKEKEIELIDEDNEEQMAEVNAERQKEFIAAADKVSGCSSLTDLLKLQEKQIINIVGA